MASRVRRWGLALGQTLMVVVLLLLLAMVVVVCGFSHLDFSSRIVDAQHAQNLAESTLSATIARLMANRHFKREVKVQTTTNGPAGVVVFDRQQARALGIEYSTNNLDDDNSVQGAGGRSVPPESAYLLATATYRGVTRVAEAVVLMPRFPYVVASSGTFSGKGDVLVASLPRHASGIPSPHAMRPGDIASNGTGARAIVLGPRATVTGNVRSAGGVQLEGAATVLGEIQTRQDPVALPSLDVASYDPSLAGNTQVLTNSQMVSPVLSGTLRRAGDLSVTGGLRLQGAILFVAGNLSVSGGIQGIGAVVVQGRTSIDGTSNLTTDNQVALLSAGNVALVGSGQDGSFFRGLIYTEGNINLDGVTLVGSLVANSSAPGGSTVVVRDSRVLTSPALSQVTFRAGATQSGEQEQESSSPTGSDLLPGPGARGFCFDFNQFIAPAQRMRVVYWRVR